jgi:hypothetical protein
MIFNGQRIFVLTMASALTALQSKYLSLNQTLNDLEHERALLEEQHFNNPDADMDDNFWAAQEDYELRRRMEPYEKECEAIFKEVKAINLKAAEKMRRDAEWDYADRYLMS